MTRYPPLAMLLLLLLLACADEPTETEGDWLEVRVQAGDDDAEEDTAGEINLGSSDLELVTEDTVQTVGIRFAQVGVPGGARILEAHLQFEVDELSAFPTFLAIKGQLDPDPPAFQETVDDLSRRPSTDRTVNWEPEVWTTPGREAGDQRTPDLGRVLQELVDQPGWGRHQAMVFLFTGTGTRTATSFDGDPEGAPLLQVLWEDG